MPAVERERGALESDDLVFGRLFLGGARPSRALQTYWRPLIVI